MSEGHALIDRLRRAVAPDFSVARELDRGGMGTVFLGHDLRLDRDVAIKVLRPELASAVGAERFLQETRILAKFTSPYLVPIYHPGDREGLLYYVMPYLRGATLARRLERGRLSVAETVRLGCDVLRGLEETHQAKVIHRDIKPSNIFLEADRAILGDFGIARSIDRAEAGLTEEGARTGTVLYWSPEQASGSPVVPQTDLYALGLVLYEASSGARLSLTPEALIDWSRVPRALRSVLRRALRWDPNQRWPDAAAFRHALALAGKRSFLAIAPRGLAVAAVTAAVAAWLLHPRPQPVCPDRVDLALLPFTVTGGPTTISGGDLTELVRARLEWYGRLSLAPRACRPMAPGAASPDPSRESRAQFMVDGFVVTDGPVPLLTLTVSEGTRTVTRLAIPENLGGVRRWGSMAADTLIHRVFPALWQDFITLSEGSSPNTTLEAWTQYFGGERAFERGAYNAAKAAYDSALVLDSNFIQAAWRLSIVKRFLREPFVDDLRQLLDRHHDLPPQYRNLIAALLEPDLKRRFALYRETVDGFPRDGYARFVYADELYHRGPLIGYPLDSAMAQFRKTIEVEPYLDQMPAYTHLLLGYLRLGWRAEADSMLDRIGRVPPSGEDDDARRRRFMRLAYDLRFHPWRARLKLQWLGIAPGASTLDGISRYNRLGSSFDIPDGMVPLGRLLVEDGADPYTRANGYAGIGLSYLMTGRPTAALVVLDSAASGFALRLTEAHPGPFPFQPVDSLLEQAEWRIMPGVLGLPGIPDQEVARGRLRLQELLRRKTAVPRAAFALALDALANADTAGALRYAGLVRELAPSDPGVTRLVLLLDAIQAGVRGHPDSALALTGPLLGYWPEGALVDPFARAVLYLHGAEWLRATGHAGLADTALIWHQNSDHGIEGWPQRRIEPGEVDNVLSVYARLLRAESAVARQDLATACPLLARVLELWEAAEPGMAPLKQRAERSFEQCTR